MTVKCDWCDSDHEKAQGVAVVSRGREWRFCSQDCKERQMEEWQ